MIYGLVKSLHIISMTAWMAGLLYLPRLFVYHCDATPGSQTDKVFQTMERRLYRYIMTPAMIASWGFGLWLIFGFVGLTGPQHGWLHAKLVIVLALSGFQAYLRTCCQAFSAGKNTRSKKFYKYINELPTAALITIVFLVILKPF